MTSETAVRLESEIPDVIGVDKAEGALALRLLGVSDRLEPESENGESEVSCEVD